MRRHHASGKKYVLEALTEVIDLLAIGDDRSIYMLGTRWRDHALKGDKQRIREIHLSQDDLLLYEIDEQLNIVKLLDITNHEELRKHG